MMWKPIGELKASDNRKCVLIIGKYPLSNNFSDIYDSWVDDGVYWPRWPHQFAPTHYMDRPKPPVDNA